MYKNFFLLASALCCAGETIAATNFVELQTTVGTIEIELLAGQAPVTVGNFLTYVDEGFYRNTLIHRVVSNFVIQGGGYDLEGGQKKVHAPIVNEAANQLSNTRGTIAMARTDDPDSATSQFFINTNDNTNLDYNSGTGNAGYAVFGRVVRGLDVVDRINALPVFREFPFTKTHSLVFFEATYSAEAQDPNNHFARVLLSGDGKGKVTSDPQGVNCGAACAASFPTGTAVKLKAKASKGSVFSGWRGDCQSVAAVYSVTLDTNQNCTAVFTRK